MPRGLDINRPSDWLLPASPSTSPLPGTSPLGIAEANPLHFVVAGSGGGITARPYFEIQQKGEIFTNYPCFPQ
jgi:hypothetical protein